MTWVQPVSTVEGERPRSVGIALGEGRYIPLVFGEAQVPGLITEIFTISGHWYLGVVWCMGEVEAVSEILLDGEAAVSGVTIETDLGTGVAAPRSLLIEGNSSYSDTKSFSRFGRVYRVCYSAIKYTDAQYPSPPAVIATVKGMKINAGAYSDNPSDVQRFLCTNAQFGLGETVNSASFDTVRARCNQTVGSAKRRTIGMVLDQPETVDKVIARLDAYSSAWTFREAGTWVSVSDEPVTSWTTLQESHWVRGGFVGSVSDPRSAPAVVEIEYTDGSATGEDVRRIARYEPDVTSPTPADRIRISRVRMPGIRNYQQAYREAEERYLKLQRRKRATLTGIDEFMRMRIGDGVTLPASLNQFEGRYIVREHPAPLKSGLVQIKLTEYGDTAPYSNANPTNPYSNTYVAVVGGAGIQTISTSQYTYTGGWANSTSYSVNDTVDGKGLQNYRSFRCIQSHTSDASSLSQAINEPIYGYLWGVYWEEL